MSSKSIILKSISYIVDLLFIVYLIFAPLDAKNIYFVIFFASFIPTLFFLIIHKCIKLDFLSISTLFLLTNYVFNFGQIILMALFPRSCDNLTIVFRYFSERELVYGLRILCIFYINLALSLSFFIRPTISDNKEILYSKIYFRYGKIILLLTLPIKIIIDFFILYMAMNGGFSAAKAALSSIPDFLVTYSNFSVIGISLLLISLKNKERMRNILFIITVLYFLIVMLSGRRSESVAYLLIIFYIFVSNRRKKIKLKDYLLIGMLGFFLLGMLRAIVLIRNLGTKDLNGIFSAIERVFTVDNVIFEALREYGNTGYTAVCVITKYLPIYGISFGKSYIYGLSAVFPNVFGLAGELTRESAFAEILQKTGSLSQYYTNIGGSFIGESIFNFGIFGGVLFILFVGTFISKFSDGFDRSLRTGNIFNLSFSMLIAFAAIYWTRDYFGGRIREVVWGALFVWLVLEFFHFKKDVERVKVTYVKSGS